MFKNIGNKIKFFSGIFFALAIIGGIVGGILFCISTSSAWGLLIIAVVVLFGYVGSICLYGFGELIESNQYNSYYLSEILRRMDKQGNPNSTLNIQPQDSSKYATVGWTCDCGKTNPAENMSCIRCGKQKQ